MKLMLVHARMQIVELVRPLATQRGIVTQVVAPESGDVVVAADRQRLNQVLMNLVSNAIKYNRSNGRVTIAFEPAAAGRMRITVTDTGAGIPPAKLALLFRPFERLGAEQTDVEGTGLGLAVARGLAEAMGGSLGVESRVDEGTTFWIELAVSAFSRLKRPLWIVGDGPSRDRLAKAAGPSVRFLGSVGDTELPRLYAGARFFVLPGAEDFGIAAVEAQAAGRPVLALGSGGALETVVQGETGIFFGQPTGIVKQLRDWIGHGTQYGSLWLQIWITMKEALLGFLYGVIAGVVVGVVLGQSPFLAQVVGPYIKVLNAIPRIVLGSIFVVALGLGTTSKVLLAGVLVFFVVFFNAFQGVREVDKNLLANARILGADGRRLTTEVIIPSALSWIMASLHVSFGFALVGAVVGEYLGAIKGVGLMIVVAQNTFNANGVFAAIVILATVALVAEAIVTAIENRLVKWRPNAVTEVTI